MKKFLITTILIFITLIGFLSTNVFAVTVTENSFRKSLTNTIDPVNSLVEMDTVNDIITVVASNIKIKYNFNNNPKFTIDLEFNKNMTEDECINECKKIYGLVNMFPVVADHFSIDDSKAQIYLIGKMNENEKIKKIAYESIENYTSAIKFAKEMFDTDIKLSDKLFSIKSNKVSETADTYKAQINLTVDLKGDFSKLKDDALEYEKEQSDAILDAAQNAAKEYEEAQKKEQEALNKYEASSNAKILVKDLKEKLDVYKNSVQIDNKLYLKYSADEVYDIYMNMTSNAVKIFEKNTNYLKKSGYYYYDTGRLRTLPLIDYTDTLHSFLEVTSASESEAIFDVILKNIVTGDIYETYKDGLKIVKKDGDWLIDSFKFKSKVEEWDTYPEYPVIEEEKTENKQENNETEETKKEESKKEETKKEETTKNEVNAVVNTNKVENINTENNTSNISNQTTNVTTIESSDTYIIILKYALYVTIGSLAVGLIYFVYKIVKYRKDDNNKSL